MPPIRWARQSLFLIMATVVAIFVIVRMKYAGLV